MINWIFERITLLRGIYHALVWCAHYQLYKGNYGVYERFRRSDISEEELQELHLHKMICHCKCMTKMLGGTMAENWEFLKEFYSEVWE